MLYNERDTMPGRFGSERSEPNGSGRMNDSGAALIAKQGQMDNSSMNGSAIQRSPDVAGAASNSATATGLDYRDDLRDLLDKAHTDRGLTRYRLCKQMGIDSGTLSNVLAKRRHFSLEKLEQILDLLGYRLSFTKLDQAPLQ